MTTFENGIRYPGIDGVFYRALTGPEQKALREQQQAERELVSKMTPQQLQMHHVSRGVIASSPEFFNGHEALVALFVSFIQGLPDTLESIKADPSSAGAPVGAASLRRHDPDDGYSR